MPETRCLKCYAPGAQDGYHPRCAKEFFGDAPAPTIEYTLEALEELAREVVRRSITIPGVQAKLSLDIDSVRTAQQQARRLTIVGLWGRYILKPPTEDYPALPQLEDATMHLAEAAGLRTVPHTLSRLASGELTYLTRRIDRTDSGAKLAMEDLAQLTGQMTEDKYRGSIERVGRTLLRFSATPGLDTIALLHLTLFCYLTGNADMHLKNFSLITSEEGSTTLAPAYDLVATKLVIPKDPEESALTINGKKSGFTQKDFLALGRSLQIPEKAIRNTFEDIEAALPGMLQTARTSFLPENMRSELIQLIQERAARIAMKIPGGQKNL